MLDFYVVGRTSRDDCGKSYLLAEATCPKCQKVFQASKSNMARAKSCGCGQGRRTHGMTGTKMYRCWMNMKNRCNNPKDEYYKDYGGRGITIQPDWVEFQNFYNDMSDSHSDTLTLDRIDNNGNYCKENCRWATHLEQGSNKRNSIIYKGETARQAGIRINGNPSLVYQRLAVGMDKETAFTKLSRRQKEC